MSSCFIFQSVINSIIYGVDSIFYYIWDRVVIVNRKFYYKDNMNDIEVSFYWIIMTIIKYKRVDILKVISRMVKIRDYLKVSDINIIHERCSLYDDKELSETVIRLCAE